MKRIVQTVRQGVALSGNYAMKDTEDKPLLLDVAAPSTPKRLLVRYSLVAFATLCGVVGFAVAAFANGDGKAVQVDIRLTLS